MADMTEFDYLLNRFERASQSDKPAEHRYGAHRKALYAYVRDLEQQQAVMRQALEWYQEQARLCRLIHSEGDAGRQALSADGGSRARAALSATMETP